MKGCSEHTEKTLYGCYGCKNILLDAAVEVLKFYRSPWRNERCDQLNREGGFFPYDVDATDQGKDEGQKADEFLNDIQVPARPEGEKK